MADVAGNNGTQAGLTVTVDNTAPTASDNQPTNKVGGTAGQAEAGDLVTLTFSEPIEPCSLLANWDGTSTTVTARLTNSATSDPLTIWDAANTTQLNFGSIDTGANYVRSSATFTPSTMVASREHRDDHPRADDGGDGHHDRREQEVRVDAVGERL